MNEVEQHRKTNEGLYTVYAEDTTKSDIRSRGEDPAQTIYVASDGSVLDPQLGGSYAWFLFHKTETGKYVPWGVEGIRREYLGKLVVGTLEGRRPLATLEAHSYRMEAAALLSGLVYLREEMQWSGTIEWHTDSQSVIDTSDKITWSNMTHCIKQRDKDIWDPLREELKEWDGRLNLHHVESHTDRKKNEDGIPRKVTPIEEMNQWADKLADWAAWENITELQTTTLQRSSRTKIKYSNKEITGNWRKQTLEEIRLGTTKRLAVSNPQYWGVCPEDIAWHRMIRSGEKLGTYARMKMAQMMHGKRTTKDFLVKFGLIDEDRCDMCQNGKETNAHVMNECTHVACTGPRGKIAQILKNLISEQGGNYDLLFNTDVIYELYNVNTDGNGTDRNIESMTIVMKAHELQTSQTNRRVHLMLEPRRLQTLQN